MSPDDGALEELLNCSLSEEVEEVEELGDGAAEEEEENAAGQHVMIKALTH